MMMMIMMMMPVVLKSSNIFRILRDPRIRGSGSLALGAISMQGGKAT